MGLIEFRATLVRMNDQRNAMHGGGWMGQVGNGQTRRFRVGAWELGQSQITGRSGNNWRTDTIGS